MIQPSTRLNHLWANAMGLGYQENPQWQADEIGEKR